MSDVKRTFRYTIVNNHKNENKEGFYATPPRGTRALLSVEKFEGAIWECACGNGTMAEVLKEGRRARVIATDLYDRGYGETGIDFLLQTRSRAPNIVTNPPFKLAEKFLYKALDLANGKIAFLCRLAWLEGQTRRTMFETTPLARVWIFSKRLPTLRDGEIQYFQNDKEGGGMVAFAWYIWDRSHKGPPVIGWIS